MKQWYEIDPELLEMEKIAMAKAFPHFTLDKLDDGRLYWIGEITPGIYETKFDEKLTYTVMAVYESCKAVRIYPVLPDCEDLMRMIGGKLWFNRDDAGNLCLKLEQFIEQKLSVTDYLGAAIKWLKKYEMLVCGFTQPLTGCLSQI